MFLYRFCSRCLPASSESDGASRKSRKERKSSKESEKDKNWQKHEHGTST